MDKKAKSAREIKEDKVQILTDKFNRAKTITFADYRGLTANQIAGLRSKIKESGGEMLIEKNTLISLTLKATNHKIEKEQQSLLTGPTATIVAYSDEIAPIKEAALSAKTLGLPTFKFGFFNSDFLNAEDVDKLSRIPGRDALHAKIVGSLNAPIFGIVSVLSGNLRNLVYTLNAIREKKGNVQ
jgi:large subunit ribosomal protein L10